MRWGVVDWTMRSGLPRRTLLLVALGMLVGAGTATEPPEPRAYRGVRIEGVPHVRQKPDFCGEACAEMALRRLGHDLTQDDVFDAAGLDPMLARGAWTRDLKPALEAIGFDVGQVWYRVPAEDAEEGLEDLWARVHADLVAGVPAIVCMHFDAGPRDSEHFRLVLGYDADTDEVLYHEPAEDDGAYRRMDRGKFLALWPLKYDPRQWTVVWLRLKLGSLRHRRVEGLSDADYAQHYMALRERVPEGFTAVLQRPFIVLGDEAPERVRARAEGTVKWAVDALKRDFFERDPAEIHDIWLFKDGPSYRHHAKALFGHEPSTPYGYASSSERVLVMNIATGGGTLVHEIVHPYLAANFPEVPAWFNEGLASLYEQSGSRDGHIVGYTNWRLAGLQRAIEAGSVPSFRFLTHTTTHEFYEEDPGTNYAQARYLLYYLQEKGLLVEYYRAFHAARGC
ncbi:MAG: C39 family peptidase [Deltaproteobacteria bacterium]|nr:C39 family peptidase [Deltaproteobacteria bacterium]